MLLLVLFAMGCSTTEHLRQGEILVKSSPTFEKAEVVEADSTEKKNFLSKIKIVPDGVPSLDPSTLYSAVRTRPNRRMVLPKTYLHLYMLGKSLQKPLSQLAPPTRTGRDFNGKFFNDLVVISLANDQLLSFGKYLEQRYFPERHYIDSLGSFLEKTAGEAPNLLDTMVLASDITNLETVYFSQGYLNANASYVIDTCKGRNNRQKAKVKFLVNEGRAAMIGAYLVDSAGVSNPEMSKALMSRSEENLIVPGDLYNETKLSAERNRVVELMRSSGFYTFSPSLVTFDIDTVPDTNIVSGVQPNNSLIKAYYPITIRLNVRDEAEHFHIRNITMKVDPAEFDPEQDSVVRLITSAFLDDSLRSVWDITENEYDSENNTAFLGYPRVLQKLNFNFLNKLIAYHEGDLYSFQNERKTQRRLQNLGIFKYVLVKHEVDRDARMVDVRIEAQLLRKYQLKAGVEGFSENDPLISQNLPGFGAELGFRNLMVFKGAERLDLSFASNLSFFRPGEADDRATFFEASGNVSFRVPRFLIPFGGYFTRWNLQSLQPVTTFGATFSREDTRAYTRNSTTLDWNYSWFHGSINQKAKSSLSPYTISFVDSNLDPKFTRSILDLEDKELRNLFILDFTPRFSSWGRYQFTLSDYMSSKVIPTGFFQPTLEMGGNTPFLIDYFNHLGSSGDEASFLGARDKGIKDSRLGNVQYGQYLKVSLEGKGHFPVSRNASIVVRGLVGAANPWNFAPYVPLQSRFFAGGTNGMRGWLSNTLGPGTYRPTIDDSTAAGFSNIFTLGGEMIVMANAELRANVYKFVELAIFSDIGNVWFLPGSEVDFPGAKLSKSNYLELGWDIGLGLRMDFSFFIFRLDLAQQMYAPDLGDFVVKSFPKDLGADRFQLNFGIGYPF